MSDTFWPDAFTDSRVAVISAAVESSDITYSTDEDMSNLDKMAYIKKLLVADTTEAHLLTEFPYQEIYDAANGHAALAGQYMCDLRVQLLDRLIAELYSDNPVPLLRCKVANLVWLVRFREKVRLHNLSVKIKDKSGEHTPPTVN